MRAIGLSILRSGASLKTLHIGQIIGSQNRCVNIQKYPASRVSGWLTVSVRYSKYHRAAPMWISSLMGWVREEFCFPAPSTRPENRAGGRSRRAIDLATSLKTLHIVFEGIEAPVRCWKTGPPTRRPRHMKRLLDALSRVWKLIRILFVLKTVRDFMRDHFDGPL